MQLHKDWSVPAITAGFVAVLVSYSGPLAIFFQAAQSADISNTMMTSWVWAISIGAAVSGILLSLWLKVPVVTAWSAPGTALLVTLFPGLSLNEAVGAYLTAAMIIFVIGITGSFDRIIQMIPPGIASAMMAGQEVVIVNCLDNGDIDLGDLREKAEEHRDRLMALMVT